MFDYDASSFRIFLNYGLKHILDIQGYDHILFVIVLCAAFNLNQWKKILFLITSFTIGHCITLFLASQDLIRVNRNTTELLIAVTILVAAMWNVIRRGKESGGKSRLSLSFFLAGIAGLIHGLGFSSYLKTILSKQASVIVPLLAFNIGLELGQIIIIAVYLLISFIAVYLIGVNRGDWRFFFSAATAGIALTLILERI